MFGRAPVFLFVVAFALSMLPEAVGFHSSKFLGPFLRFPIHVIKTGCWATATSTSTTLTVCSRSKPRWRGCGVVGVGGLCASLEVEPMNRLENGCVLVAGAENYGHMTSKAVALVYEHAEGQATKAVCLDRGLAFTIGEMFGGDSASLGRLADNRLFRGGDDGSGAIVLHNHFVDGARALGDTGLYVGGLAAAVELTDNRGAKAEDFKFFFSHLAWPDGGLEQQVEKGLWKIVKLPNDVILEAKQERDMELWGRIKRALKRKVE